MSMNFSWNRGSYRHNIPSLFSFDHKRQRSANAVFSQGPGARLPLPFLGAGNDTRRGPKHPLSYLTATASRANSQRGGVLRDQRQAGLGGVGPDHKRFKASDERKAGIQPKTNADLGTGENGNGMYNMKFQDEQEVQTLSRASVHGVQGDMRPVGLQFLINRNSQNRLEMASKVQEGRCDSKPGTVGKENADLKTEDVQAMVDRVDPNLLPKVSSQGLMPVEKGIMRGNPMNELNCKLPLDASKKDGQVPFMRTGQLQRLKFFSAPSLTVEDVNVRKYEVFLRKIRGGPWMCKLCTSKCNNFFTFHEHMMGEVHKQNIELLKEVVPLETFLSFKQMVPENHLHKVKEGIVRIVAGRPTFLGVDFCQACHVYYFDTTEEHRASDDHKIAQSNKELKCVVCNKIIQTVHDFLFHIHSHGHKENFKKTHKSADATPQTKNKAEREAPSDPSCAGQKTMLMTPPSFKVTVTQRTVETTQTEVSQVSMGTFGNGFPNFDTCKREVIQPATKQKRGIHLKDDQPQSEITPLLIETPQSGVSHPNLDRTLCKVSECTLDSTEKKGKQRSHETSPNEFFQPNIVTPNGNTPASSQSEETDPCNDITQVALKNAQIDISQVIMKAAQSMLNQAVLDMMMKQTDSHLSPETSNHKLVQPLLNTVRNEANQQTFGSPPKEGLRAICDITQNENVQTVRDTTNNEASTHASSQNEETDPCNDITQVALKNAQIDISQVIMNAAQSMLNQAVLDMMMKKTDSHLSPETSNHKLVQPLLNTVKNEANQQTFGSPPKEGLRAICDITQNENIQAIHGPTQKDASHSTNETCQLKVPQPKMDIVQNEKTQPKLYSVKPKGFQLLSTPQNKIFQPIHDFAQIKVYPAISGYPHSEFPLTSDTNYFEETQPMVKTKNYSGATLDTLKTETFLTSPLNAHQTEETHSPGTVQTPATTTDPSSILGTTKSNSTFALDTSLMETQPCLSPKKSILKIEEEADSEDDETVSVSDASEGESELSHSEDDDSASENGNDEPLDISIYDPDVIVGQQYITPVSGFFCKLCRIFYNTKKSALVQHCRSELHFNNLKAISEKWVRKVWVVGDGYVLQLAKAAKSHKFADTLGLPNTQCNWKGKEGLRYNDFGSYLQEILADGDKPDIIIVHIGSENIGPDNLKSLKIAQRHCAWMTRQLLPSCKIVWSDILPKRKYEGNTVKKLKGIQQGSYFRYQSNRGLENTRHKVNTYARTLMWRMGHSMLRHLKFRYYKKKHYRKNGKALSNAGADVILKNLRDGLRYFDMNPNRVSFPIPKETSVDFKQSSN